MTTDRLTSTEITTVEEQAQVVLHRVQQVLSRLEYLANRADNWKDGRSHYAKGVWVGTMDTYHNAGQVVRTVFGLPEDS